MNVGIFDTNVTKTGLAKRQFAPTPHGTFPGINFAKRKEGETARSFLIIYISTIQQMKTILRGFGFALALLPAFANANLLVNGDFESTAISSGSWTILNSNALTGWSAGQNGVELRNNVAGAAYSGSQYLELDTTANSSIMQTVQTTIGQNYLLSFAYAPREGVSAASNAINVFWNDSLLASITGDGTHNAGNIWQMYSFNVLAVAPMSTISFAADGISESYGGSLDATSLDAASPAASLPAPSTVPEPGMLALLGLGFAGLGLSRRKRAN